MPVKAWRNFVRVRSMRGEMGTFFSIKVGIDFPRFLGRSGGYLYALSLIIATYGRAARRYPSTESFMGLAIFIRSIRSSGLMAPVVHGKPTLLPPPL